MADKEVIDRLDKIVKLTEIMMVGSIKGLETKEQVKLLSSAGLQPREIGRLLGKTANNIRVTLHEVRKRR